MFLNLQHPHIRYIAPPAEGGSDITGPTPPAEPNGNGEEIDWEAKYKEALGHSRDWEKKAKANKAALVPFLLKGVADVPNAAKLFQADRIHPNESAHPTILNTMWPAVRALLR